ncbi:hypothetical protein CRV24_010489 [Beauveria bassiana]|nr:hypothetical protein CRV24_010489 [Beauveria bassiana]KAH8715520.1 hypothetical protein HC256_004335 [Beauveria bassiana]
MENDTLYDPKYTHRHQKGCSVCVNDPSAFCESASRAFCVETGCDSTSVVARERFAGLVDGGDFIPGIFIGRIGSGNTVMKSGEDRDRIAADNDLIAFEMEGAGAWDQVPCIVVKGICDYADSHKNKSWQDFAAATAASVAKAILERYQVHDEDRETTLKNNQGYSNGRGVGGSWMMQQGDAAPFKKSQSVPLGSLAHSDTAKFLERKEETGERKWEKIQRRRKRARCCFNCGSEWHWEETCREVFIRLTQRPGVVTQCAASNVENKVT